MKFTVNREEFIRNLGIADSIINIKTPLAMLLNVYIEAQSDGTIMLLSYNGENGVKVDATGTVEEGGKIALLSKKLLEAVKKLPGERISFKTKPDNEHEVILNPEGKENPVFNINGVSGDAYPIFFEFNWETYIKTSQETLLEQIISTEFSISTDFAKPAFTGTYLEESVDGYLSFVTSDGKRLAVITRDYEEKKGEVKLGVIVPQRIFKTLQPILTTGDVLFSVHNNQAFFKIGQVYVFSNLVDGKFPNYKDVIPAERVNIITLDSAEFLQAIDVVSVMSDPETGKTKFELSENKLTILTTHPIYGVAREELTIDYKGTPITIMCNYKAIVDFLKVTQGKRIEFVINSQGSPMLFKTIGDENFIYISMPLKLYE